jgi:hypothetical protein
MSNDMVIYGLSAFCDDACRKVFTDKAVERTRAKAASKAKREQQESEKKARGEIRARKEALKSRGDYLKDAQREFNRFIRLRDHDQPCISCNRFHDGKYDAGHYRSVGAAPHLRFNEDNNFKQCVPCNQHKSGNAIEYRINLVQRIGAGRVEAIESNNEPAKWTIEDIKAIQTKYRLKANILEKELGLR